jgi:hypothetical protein
LRYHIVDNPWRPNPHAHNDFAFLEVQHPGINAPALLHMRSDTSYLALGQLRGAGRAAAAGGGAAGLRIGARGRGLLLSKLGAHTL